MRSFEPETEFDFTSKNRYGSYAIADGVFGGNKKITPKNSRYFHSEFVLNKIHFFNYRVWVNWLKSFQTLLERLYPI